MGLKVALVFHVTLLSSAYCWTQQYGDTASTNYVPYQGSISSGWNYTTPPFVSQTSPAVSKEGTIFYPLRATVVAILSNGTILWTSGVAPNGNAYLTNVVVAEWVSLVIVGASWVEGDTYMQVVALHVQNGSTAWTSQQNDLYHSTTISISQTTNSVCLGGFDKGVFAALSLEDGSVLWQKSNIYLVGLFMQTKIGFWGTGTDEEMVLLPTDPFNGAGGKGGLFSYQLDSSGKTYWSVDVGFDEGALFAFSAFGIIFGFDGTGGGVGGMKTFGINATSGDIIFSNFGFCNPIIQNSGPAVDFMGYAYYSCGNQVYSVYPNGSLRWISEVYGEPNRYFSISPSLHPRGILYFIHSNESALIALSTQDGSFHKLYEIVPLPYLEPPIIVGDSMIYLFGFVDSSIVMYPLVIT